MTDFQYVVFANDAPIAVISGDTPEEKVIAYQKQLQKREDEVDFFARRKSEGVTMKRYYNYRRVELLTLD